MQEVHKYGDRERPRVGPLPTQPVMSDGDAVRCRKALERSWLVPGRRGPPPVLAQSGH